jgi:hypothetical protein
MSAQPQYHQSKSAPVQGLVKSIICTFSLPLSGNPSRFSSPGFTPFTEDWVHLLNCPISMELEDALVAAHYDILQLEMDWTLHEADKHFVNSVALSPQQLEPVKEVRTSLYCVYRRMLMYQSVLGKCGHLFVPNLGMSQLPCSLSFHPDKP